MLPKLELMVLVHVKCETRLDRPVQDHEEYIHEQEEKVEHCIRIIHFGIVPSKFLRVKHHQCNIDQYEKQPDNALLVLLNSMNRVFFPCIGELNDFQFFYAKHSLELNKVGQDAGLLNSFPDEGKEKHLLENLNSVRQFQCDIEFYCA